MPALPEFSNEEEFAEFVETHDMADYWDAMKPVDASCFRVPLSVGSINKLSDCQTEEELAEYVDTHDTSADWDEMEPVDASQFRVVRPQHSSVRVPFSRSTLEQLKAAAKQRHQSGDALLQQWVAERLQQEQSKEPITSS
jgi:hypothetical protein